MKTSIRKPRIKRSQLVASTNKTNRILIKRFTVTLLHTSNSRVIKTVLS